MINILPIYARPFWREQGHNGLGSGDLPFLELTPTADLRKASQPC
jgi:monoamine oxidase